MEPTTNKTADKTANKTATNVAPTPAPTPAPAKSDAEVLAEADAIRLKAEQAKKDADAKVADLQTKISDCKAKIANRNAYLADQKSEDATFEPSEQDKKFLQSKTDLMSELTKELADVKLSLLTPAQKDLASRHATSLTELENATKKHADLEAKIRLEYPDFFGKVSVPKVKKVADGTATSTSTSEIKPFTGKLLSKDEATAKVKALVATGMTSESAMIQNIYGSDFSITGDARVNIGNGNPRAQIHQIRKDLGLVSVK